jgi:hypothetical protein
MEDFIIKYHLFLKNFSKIDSDSDSSSDSDKYILLLIQIY